MSGAEAHSVSLLIVDDEMLNRELLRRVLQRDYQIAEAEDAEHALEILEAQAEKVRLILCDQLMPGQSGTELAELVRDRWPEIRFVLLTGYDDDPSVKAARASGLVRHVISKPWRATALRDLIEEELAAAAAS